MSDYLNSMLLNPGATTQDAVPKVQGHTPAYPVVLLEETYYFLCTMLNHHMHRPDGKRLAFMFNVLPTNDMYDITYLNGEITAGNPFIRVASEEEINTYRMRTNPRGTIEDQLRPQIEADIRDKLDAELEAMLAAKLSQVGYSNMSDEQKTFVVAEMVADKTAALKIAGTDALSKLQAMRADKVDVGGGTMYSGSSALQGIVGTDKLPTAAG